MLDERMELETAVREMRRQLYDGLTLFRPMPSQLPVLRSQAREIIVRGGNRSGKSILAAAMFASAARQVPIVDSEGNEYWWIKSKRPLTLWAIGHGEIHIAQTLYRLLFKPGLVPIYRDPATGLVRAARNFEELHATHEATGDQSGALIPTVGPTKKPLHEIAEIAWQGKSEDLVIKVTMRNGTVIYFFTSTGNVKMGDPVDGILLDEDIQYPDYVAEWQARLADRRGRLLWAVWPHASNWALRQLSDRAKTLKGMPKPHVEEFRLTFRDNPFIESEEKQALREGWAFAGESVLRARDEGEFASDDAIMYPNYSAKLVHGLGRDGPPDDALERFLRPSLFIPPPDWTHRLIIDPGHTVAAVLFAATPPPELFDVVVVYDEVYLRLADADALAKAIKAKTAGRVIYEFIIDGHGARLAAIGTGKSVEQQYREAFERHGLRSVITGSGFTLSSDDVAGGLLAVRDWLTIRTNGTTKLRVRHSAMPNFEHEISVYHKMVTRDETQDKPATGQRDHLMDDLRYAAAHGCEYRPFDLNGELGQLGGVWRAFQQWKSDGQPQTSSTVHCGPGVINAAA